MRVGISTASLFRRLNNEDSLPLLAEWGVPAAEVFLTSFCEYEPSFATLLAARKGRLETESVHVLNTQYEPQLYAAHPRVRGDAYRLLEKTMRSARILGAGKYTFHGIARIKRTFREDLVRTAEETRRIAEFCAGFGVKLCFENVEWAFYNRPGVFRALKAGYGDLLGVLDIKQARISGYDYREYLAEMGPSLSHVHVCDFTDDGTCLPGRGSFDFDELFRRLAGEGFRGSVFLECYASDFSSLPELRQAYEYLAERAEKFGGA